MAVAVVVLVVQWCVGAVGWIGHWKNPKVLWVVAFENTPGGLPEGSALEVLTPEGWTVGGLLSTPLGSLHLPLRPRWMALDLATRVPFEMAFATRRNVALEEGAQVLEVLQELPWEVLREGTRVVVGPPPPP